MGPEFLLTSDVSRNELHTLLRLPAIAKLLGQVLVGRFGFLIFANDQIKNFFAMDGDFSGSLDAQSHFVTTNFYDRDRNVIVDDNALAFLSG